MSDMDCSLGDAENTDDLYRSWRRLQRKAEHAERAARAAHNRWVKAYLVERRAGVRP